MNKIGFIKTFIFQLLCWESTAQCNNVVPIIKQLTVENKTQLTLTVEKPSADAYELVEKLQFGAAFAKVASQNIITADGLYTINMPLNEGSCFRLQSNVADCPYSADVCLPEWEILNDDGRNVLYIRPDNIDEVEILKNNLQIDRRVTPSAVIEINDTDIECRKEEIYRLVVRQGNTRIITIKKPVLALAGACAILNVVVPGVFTPNGDGKNDSFGAFGTQQDFFSLKVFDRWQNMVFSTSQIDLFWNGTFENNGEMLPNGLYYYQLKKLDQKANITTETGQLMLMR